MKKPQKHPQKLLAYIICGIFIVTILRLLIFSYGNSLFPQFYLDMVFSVTEYMCSIISPVLCYEGIWQLVYTTIFAVISTFGILSIFYIRKWLRKRNP